MDTYENKYKEALERAKAMIKVAANQDEAIGFANTIFPELKESEDEKVEKAIFGMVYDSDNELWSSYDVTKSDVLAWLEKQGKQKFEMKTAEESLGIDSDTYNKIVDECIFGEQKPEENKGNLGRISPNWIEDEDMVDEIIVDIEVLKEQERTKDGKALYQKEIDWLIALKDRIQPRQEWNEEDECYMTECINAIATKDSWSFEEKRKTKHWVKSLKQRIGG